MESLLDEEEVLSRQTVIIAKQAYNFWSDRWIALNVLHEFPDAVVVVPPMESLVVHNHILSRHTGITGETCHNF
jgi:hypothetical protein